MGTGLNRAPRSCGRLSAIFYLHKLVDARANAKTQVHGVLGRPGVKVPVSDQFEVAGNGRLRVTAVLVPKGLLIGSVDLPPGNVGCRRRSDSERSRLPEVAVVARTQAAAERAGPVAPTFGGPD